MKKLFIIFLMMFLTPFSSLAISLEGLQSDSNRYIAVAQTASSTMYVDKDSIESIRYAPPYYTMRCRVYNISYTSDVIFDFIMTANYDYNQNYQEVSHRVLEANPGISWDAFIKKTGEELIKDSGITCSITDNYIWSLEGESKGKIPAMRDEKCQADSAMYHVANYMFYVYYNEYFGSKYESKDLY